MTYRQLAETILRMEDDQQTDDVTVYLERTDEHFGATGLTFVVGDDVLHDNHPILTIPF